MRLKGIISCIIGLLFTTAVMAQEGKPENKSVNQPANKSENNPELNIEMKSDVKANTKINFSFNNEEASKVIETYAAAAKQKIIMDANVRGKLIILLPEPVTLSEAFNHLSSALALNGYGFSKQGDVLVLRSARNVQRDLVEVSTTLPAATPDRMVTWLYTPKYLPAESINRDLRILASKDGELSVFVSTNQLIMTDWVSNIYRVAAMLKELDKPVSSVQSKIIEKQKEKRIERQLEMRKNSNKMQTKPRGAHDRAGVVPPEPPPEMEEAISTVSTLPVKK